MAIALHHSRARGSAKLALLGIANHDGDGGSWPSMAKIAVYAGTNLRNASNAVDELIKKGEVAKHINQGGNLRTPEHMRPNLYSFLLKCPPNCDRTTQHRMLCTVCEKELPLARREKLTHTTCDPLSPATPPVASDGGPLSPATDEPSFTPLPIDIQKPHLPERAREAESDGLAAGSYPPASRHGLAACGHAFIDDRHCEYGCHPQEVTA